MEASLRNQPIIDIDTRWTGHQDLRSKVAPAKKKDGVPEISIGPRSNAHGFVEGDLGLGVHCYSACVLLTSAVSVNAPVPSTYQSWEEGP